jgi:small nuclear ribonucleoprotein (snRNP)-like protein
MIIRNPNQSDFIGKDDELSFVPFQNDFMENNFIENDDELSFVPSENDEYSDYSESNNRFIPPILNNPMGQMFFGPPGGPPGGPGGPGGPQGGPPGPPPSSTPNKLQATSFAGGPQAFVSPGSIRPCRFQFVYIWLRNGRSFWAWLTHIDRRTAAGFRWTGRRWVYFGVDLRRIDFFMCFGRSENRQSMPPGAPMGAGSSSGAPPGPPPSSTPKKPSQATSMAGGPQTFAVSPESIRPCLYQFVYLWLKNGRSFWAWLTRVDRRSASGFRWDGRRWTYFGVDLNSIEFFQCFGRGTSRQMTPPFGLPSGQGGPPGAPPSQTPTKPMQAKSMAGGPETFAVSPGSIRPCLFQFVYIWLDNGMSFWAWLTRVDRRSASGFRWNGRRWVYFGVDLRRIEFFQCFGRSNTRNVNPMDSDMYDDMDSDMYDNMNSTMDNTMSNTMNSMGNNSNYNIGNVTIEPEKFKVEYPYVTGFENQEVQGNINDAIIGEVTSLLSSQVLLPAQNTFKEIIISYQIPLKTDNLLSIVFALYTDTGGAHGNTTFSSLTFNTNTGQVYDLEDLFKPNSNYMNVLSELAVREAEEAEIPFIADYKGVSDNQQFYLTPNGIVLFYQVNEYTPYSYGLFRVTIPYDEIMGILNTNSPVYNLMAPAAQ